MTSVKNICVDEPATHDELGRGTFVFTDDYSMFDWGKMPDQIPDKGASLCTMGAFTFELLEENGISTHYRGVVDGNGYVRSLEDTLEVGITPREMAIVLTQVPDLPFEDGRYDYGTYFANAGKNYLIPLEIVFRNRVPIGSSLRNRSDHAEFGLEGGEWPDEGFDLPEALVEFSTKYEEQDRYLSRQEADYLAGAASIDDLESIARDVNQFVTEQAEQAGLIHQDGKIECLYHDGEIRVADVVGTFDENRFSYDGQQVSKEVIRQYHKQAQPKWVEAVNEAKSQANVNDIVDWRSLCEREPEPMDEHIIQIIRNLYCAGTNAYVARDSVFDAPSLEKVLKSVRQL